MAVFVSRNESSDKTPRPAVAAARLATRRLPRAAGPTSTAQPVPRGRTALTAHASPMRTAQTAVASSAAPLDPVIPARLFSTEAASLSQP